MSKVPKIIRDAPMKLYILATMPNQMYWNKKVKKKSVDRNMAIFEASSNFMLTVKNTLDKMPHMAEVSE